MPANLSPEYKKAQEEYRRAREPQDRLDWLREMLRTIPKHKGTEHLQADIRLLASKCELVADPGAEIATFRELGGFPPYPALAVSAETGAGLEGIGPAIFEAAGIVRVYTKVPGQSADTVHPFTIRRHGTVRDVARLIHRDLAEKLKFAKLWGSGKFAGGQVSAEHPLEDGDVIEIHT